MLRSLLSMRGYGVGAIDGDLGVLKDFYIDDETWMIRFVVVAAGGPAGRPVLISSTADCGPPDWNLQLLHVGLTIEDVLNSPDIDTEKPVSRQQELLADAYYERAGMGPELARVRRRLRQSSVEDAHLRSFEEIRSYEVHGIDGPAGKADDVIVDDSSWEGQYIVVVEPGSPFSKVLVSLDWITSVSWADRALHLDLPVEALRSCPQYEASAGINREDENKLYDYHGRPKPWNR